jgi:transcriptional regulator with XRE-family HTH domain
MTQGHRGTQQATPLQIARNGHIAILIRRQLEERQWSIPDLHERIGLSRASATAYHWLASAGAPGPKYVRKLAKLLGVPETEFAPRELDREQLPAVLAAPGYPTVGPSKPAVRSPPPSGDVLGFTVGSDGMARLRVDVRLPLEAAAPLLRLLLDAGIVMTREATDGE